MADRHRRQWHARSVGGVDQREAHRQLVRGRRGEAAVGREDRRGARQRGRDHAASHHRDWVSPVLEGDGDAEVAAAAAERPEQVQVGVRTGLQHLSAMSSFLSSPAHALP